MPNPLDPSSPAPAPAPAPRIGILSANALPEPTYHPPDPTKKSHARKQPPGHVPRPRNAFILFRCDFVRQKKVPPDVENDHRNISRIAGSVWREMGEADRAPWVAMAEREKERHSTAYPGYRYTPAGGLPAGAKRRKRGDVEEDEVSPCQRVSAVTDAAATSKKRRAVKARALDAIAVPCETRLSALLPAVPPPSGPSSSYLGLRRSSSCPPGAPRVPAFSPTLYDPATSSGSGSTTLLITRDDLARRPSRVTMYQSSSPAFSSSSSSAPSSASSATSFLSASLSTSTSPSPTHPSLVHVSPTTALLHVYSAQGRPVQDVRPQMCTGAYVLDPPGDAPGWGDAPPLEAVAWEWDDASSRGALAGHRKTAGFEELFDISPTAHAHAHAHAQGQGQGQGLPAGPAYTLLHDIHALPPLPRAFLPTFTNPFSPSSTSASFTFASAHSTSDSTSNSNSNSNSNSDSNTHCGSDIRPPPSPPSPFETPTSTPAPTPTSTPTTDAGPGPGPGPAAALVLRGLARMSLDAESHADLDLDLDLGWA